MPLSPPSVRSLSLPTASILTSAKMSDQPPRLLVNPAANPNLNFQGFHAPVLPIKQVLLPGRPTHVAPVRTLPPKHRQHSLVIAVTPYETRPIPVIDHEHGSHVASVDAWDGNYAPKDAAAYQNNISMVQETPARTGTSTKRSMSLGQPSIPNT